MSQTDAIQTHCKAVTATSRLCKACHADISTRRGNARLCASCSDARQKAWNRRNHLLRHQIDQHIDAIARASEIVRTLGNEELSGQLAEAAAILRGKQ